jgi:hypothetical protein
MWFYLVFLTNIVIESSSFRIIISNNKYFIYNYQKESLTKDEYKLFLILNYVENIINFIIVNCQISLIF